MSRFPETDPAKVLPLGFVRAALLVMGSWCTVLAAGAIAPVLPQMSQVFKDTPNLDLLIGFVATAPSLAVAVFATPLGFLADRIGLRPVLLGGLLLYGITGIIPFFMLDDLRQIIALRFLTGIGEACVMTASTALIGLMAAGATRDRMLGAQVFSANALGIGVLLAGGYAGLLGWRTPFTAYAFALVLLVPVLLMIHPPRQVANGKSASAGRTELWPHGWLGSLLLESALLIAWSTMALYALIVELGFVLTERGATDSAVVGAGQAIAAMGIALGAGAGGALAQVAVRARLILAYGAIAAGFGLVSVTSGQLDTSLSAALAGFGAGMVIPTLLSRLLGQTPAQLLGRITGVWVAVTFLAQFACPPLFVLLERLSGSLTQSFGVFGLLTTVVFGVVAVSRKTGQQQPD